MAATPFAFTTPAEITQPETGDQVIFRSDNAADTGNLTLTGVQEGDSVSSAETKALTGQREVQGANAWASLTSLKLSAAQLGTISVYGPGTQATGDIRVDSLPANNDNLKVGLTGFEQTYLFKTALTGAANEIKIAATIADQATYIYHAITNVSGAGIDHGTGTVANAYYGVPLCAGAVVTLLDNLPIARQLAPSIRQTVGSTLSIRLPVGGVTGTLLATIEAGVTHVFDSFTLDNESRAVDGNVLPALVSAVSDAINVGGGRCTLRFKCASLGGSGIPFYYQVSTDGVNWDDGLITIDADLGDSVGVVAPLYVQPSEENIEYIRIGETNVYDTDTPLDARVIY